MQEILPNGSAHSPYGATESLPLCSISAREVLGETATATATGRGTCVGRPVPEISVRIIALTEAPLASMEHAQHLPAGEIGEIIVSGPVVTKQYDQLPEVTAGAKIPGETPGSLWHRIGDVGYLDSQGRLWFCGRKAERVETPAGPLYTEQVEPIFNAHPAVRRTALIGLGERGRQQPALVVEATDPATVATPSARRKLLRELRELGQQHAPTAELRRFYLHQGFPVDVRHNAKIHRLVLARWAANQPGYEMDRREISRETLGI